MVKIIGNASVLQTGRLGSIPSRRAIRKDYYEMKEFYIVGSAIIEIGDIVWDRRKECITPIETQKDIESYYYVAPECYVVFKSK